MYRHRVNLVVKDSALNKVLHTFLRQRMPLSKRSVLECFLSQLLEDLWKEMKDEFALFVLCKAYEQVVDFPLKAKTMENIIRSISGGRTQTEEIKRIEDTKTDWLIRRDSKESPVETQPSDEEDVSIDDLLL